MDLITYCSNTSALIAELIEKAPNLVSIKDDGSYIFLVNKTRTIRNGNETLALVRDDGKLLALSADLASIIVLGTYEDVFDDPDKLAIYDRVYGQSPIEYNDDNGNKRTYTPPRKFCIFAD